MDSKKDFNKCYNFLKDYVNYMYDMTCPLCGEEYLDELNTFVEYLEKEYPDLTERIYE